MARAAALLLTLLLIATRAFPQVNPLEKPVTLSWERVTLAKALTDACQSAGLNHAFDRRKIPDSTFSASFQQQPLRVVLDRLLQPHPLSYTLQGQTLVVHPRSTTDAAPAMVTISGYVEDRETGERLAGATVHELRSRKGTIANEAGFFSLHIPADSVKLVVSMVGYAVHLERLRLRGDIRRIVRMAPDLELEAVEILEADQGASLEGLAGVGVVNVPIQDLDKLPTLLGESDPWSALKLYPGVHSGGDGSSGLYVRGGGPDQNLVLLDGVPIYNSSHLFGFYSIFNADAISSIELFKGGFPARYGGRLSSVIGIGMREGDAHKLHGEANIGLAAARVLLEGPIIKDRTTFVVAARRTILEPYFGLINRVEQAGNGNTVDYSFLDLNAKVTHRFSDRDRLFMTLYTGGDRFGSGYFIDTNNVADRFDFKLNWGNTAGIARWRRDWGPRVFSDLAAYTTRYDYTATSLNELQYLGLDSTRTELSISSAVNDVGLKGHVEIIPGTRHFIRSGFNATYHRFQPETFTQLILQNNGDTLENLAGQREIRSLETNLFIEENLTLGPLRMNLGLNGVVYAVDTTQYWSIQPRASGRLRLPAGFSLEANFTSMVQYLHLLSNAGVGLPTDLWVPATSRIPPQRALQGAFAIEKQFEKAGIELSAEAYAKTLRQLIEYQTGINFLGANNWENLVETGGTGQAMGLEFLARKHKGAFTATIGYTLSRSTRQFPTINFGKEFFYKYDRTHDLSIAMLYKLNTRMSLSADWLYATGNAITFPQQVRFAPTSPILGFWDLNEGPNLSVIIDYGTRNSFRIPPYHRLDLNFHIEWGERQRQWSANIGIFNVYNRRNPYFLFLRADYSQDAALPEIKARKMSLLPLLPSLNLGCKF